MSLEEIRQVVMKGNTGEYSHVLICCDTFDYEDYPVYVKYGEDIHDVIAKYSNCTEMSKVMEVYNYNLDLEQQLSEERAYHIEPLVPSKSTAQSNKNSKAETSSMDQEDNLSEGLKKAICYATRMHEGQKRLTGDPYIKHPLHVVQNVLRYKKSKNLEVLLIAACLHDTIEDTDATYYDISHLFGPMVASLVLELTTDEDIKSAIGKQQYLSIKMKNMSSWALVIKLCDRLDNVNDLLRCTDEAFKKKYINETMGIIDYLLKNAKLSKTHITIIEQILILLLELSKDDHEKTIKLTEMLEECSRIKLSHQDNNDIFLRLMRQTHNLDKD